MAQFTAYSESVEVNGQTVLAVVDGMGAHRSRALDILSSNGISSPAPGGWYKQQAWLDSFKAISENLGASTLFAIGYKIPENAEFPPFIKTLGDALGSLDDAYRMNHRGGDIGHYKLVRTGQREARMICTNPYPCDFDRGILSSLANKFLPHGSTRQATIKHDDSQPCRKSGADSCTYIVRW